jgi:hypothetical protein
MRYIPSVAVVFALSFVSISCAKDVAKKESVKVSSQISKKDQAKNKKSISKTKKKKNVEIVLVDSQEDSIVHTVERVQITSEDLFGSSGANFEKAFESKSHKISPDVSKALKLIRKHIVKFRYDRPFDQYAIFSELRDVFSEEEFSSGEIIELIADALEIRSKYPLILEFVVRSQYARRAVEEKINSLEALQLASSEYIYLPRFILRKKITENQINEVLTDIGCGVTWKDRAKYIFALNSYFGKSEIAISAGLKRFPKHIQNYLALLVEVSKFFTNSYDHLKYKIAQDFYYGDISKEKIIKIFSLSKDEWRNLVKPKDYK